VWAANSRTGSECRDRAHLSRYQPVVLFDPGIGIVGRSENAAAEIRAREEVAIGISSKRKNKACRQPIIYLCPVISVVGRAENAAAFKSASKNVAAGIDGQRNDKWKFQAIVDGNPSVSIVRRSKRAAKRPGEDVTGCGIDCQRANISSC